LSEEDEEEEAEPRASGKKQQHASNRTGVFSKRVQKRVRGSGKQYLQYST
jgi:hypothetical protein